MPPLSSLIRPHPSPHPRSAAASRHHDAGAEAMGQCGGGAWALRLPLLVLFFTRVLDSGSGQSRWRPAGGVCGRCGGGVRMHQAIQLKISPPPHSLPTPVLSSASSRPRWRSRSGRSGDEDRGWCRCVERREAMVTTIATPFVDAVTGCGCRF